MEEMWKNSAIIAKRNVDDNQNPISVQLYELKPVIDVHSCIVLNQLPDEFQGIEIEGFTQVYDIDKISTRNFKVDYANGVLYFHPNNIGKMLTINYYGIGCTLLSASRIYTKYDKYGNVLETLEELIDKAKLYLKAIESLGGAVEVINKLDADIEAGGIVHENLIENIEVGNQLDDSLKTNISKGDILLPKLVEANATATQKKIDLDKSIQSATDTNATLTNTNQSGIQTNLTLQQTIATGKDSIDKINATGNKSLIIGASQFVNNEYTWTHNMNSEELHITMYDADTKDPLMLDCKPDGKNKLIVRNSVEHPNIKVVLSASFYQGNALFGTNVEEFAGDSIDVGAKKVRLKDRNGVVENPITDSDAVFMSDGKTKLTEKIGDINTRLIDVDKKLRKSMVKRMIVVNDKYHPEFMGSNIYGLINMQLNNGECHLVGTVSKAGIIYDFTDGVVVYDFSDFGGGVKSGGDSYNAVCFWKDYYYFGGWIITNLSVSSSLITTNKYTYLIRTKDLKNWEVIISDKSTSSDGWKAEISDLIPTNDELFIFRGDVGKIGDEGSGVYAYNGVSVRKISNDASIKGTVMYDKLYYGGRFGRSIKEINLLNTTDIKETQYTSLPSRLGVTANMGVFSSIGTLNERLFVGTNNGFFLDKIFIPIFLSSVEDEDRCVGWRGQLSHVNGGLVANVQVQDGGSGDSPSTGAMNGFLIYIGGAGEIRVLKTGRMFAGQEVYGDKLYYGVAPHSHRNKFFNYQLGNPMLGGIDLDRFDVEPYTDRIYFNSYSPIGYGLNGYFGGYPTFGYNNIKLDIITSQTGTLTIVEWGVETDVRVRGTIEMTANTPKIIDLSQYSTGNIIGFKFSVASKIDASFYANK